MFQKKLNLLEILPDVQSHGAQWHNTVSHNTCECRVFYKKIQSDIEAGKIKFDAPEKPMKIDGHPFLANMVDVKDHDAKTGARS